jgi:hypothetical protein
MRYSGWALLLFGAGLVLGLAVVSADLAGLGRVASVWMFAGIALLPFGLVADWWSRRPWRQPARRTKRPAKRPGKRSAGRPGRKRAK